MFGRRVQPAPAAAEPTCGGGDDLLCATTSGSLTSLVEAAAALSVASTSSLDQDEEPCRQQTAEPAHSSQHWRPTPADCAASPTAPLLVAAHAGLPEQRVEGDPRCLPVNTGEPIEFDSPLFAGRAVVWARGAAGEPDHIFSGRQRRTLVTVQGRFKRPVPLDDLVTGQEFGAVENLPPGWLVEGVLLKVARALCPAAEISASAAGPFMRMPVVAACSEIHAALPGQEPDPAGAPREDLRAWDAALAAPDGEPLPAARRKAHFSRAASRRGRSWPTDLVFTFYFYQHVVDVSDYRLRVLYSFDLTKYLRGQPLQLMMRDRRSGEYLYCLHLWHERLLRAGGGERGVPPGERP